MPHEPRHRDEGLREEVLHLFKYWLATAMTIIIPYLAVRLTLPYLWDILEVATEADLDYAITVVNLNYWWVFLVYVFIANLITPRWDPDDLGLFGSRHIDNPFSWTDDYNRAMRNLALLLFPGKIVWFTLRLSARFALERLRG